jgi:ribonuclease HI
MDKNISELKNVTIYTASACLDGQGGIAAILEYKTNKKEISRAYEGTNNSKMEIIAAIVGLRLLKYPCRVTLLTDSEYLVNAMNVGIGNNGKQLREKNIELWDRLLKLCGYHEVKFELYNAHHNNEIKDRCHKKAIHAAKKYIRPKNIGGRVKIIHLKEETISERPVLSNPHNGSICPNCGGSGNLMVKAGPRSHKPSVKIMCSQCLGTGFLNKYKIMV